MKISAVSNNNINNATQANTPSFRGISDGLVNFWQFVDNGGRAIQFTVEDMCGTNFPRTIKGALAGYKYTGKINYAALAQEALREFLTGPTMCLTPLAIISLTKKSMGKTADTHIENIKNLSYIMSTLKDTPIESLDESFVKSVVSDMLIKTSGKDHVNLQDVKDLTAKILEYKKHSDQLNLPAKQMSIFSKMRLKKDLKKEVAGIGSMFEGIIKRTKDSFTDTSFLQAKYSVSETATGATKTTNYINYIVNYLTDFRKTFKDGTTKVTSEAVQKFKSGWLAKRLGIIGAMVCVTGFAMSFVPKIYTLASGNVNPNAKVIYKEAEKLPNNKGKEVKA